MWAKAVTVERDQAQKQVRTVTVERDQAREERDQARKDLVAEARGRDVQHENFKAMTRVVRELRPARRDLDAAAQRAGLEDGEIKWLTEEVERGRGGMDR